MSNETIGEICALSAAFNWALALVLFKRSGESVPPLALSLFKNVVGIILLSATLPFVWPGVQDLLTLPTTDLLLLIASGIVGIAIADTLLFYSLNLIGVGLLTIMECVYTPSVILSAWLIFSDRMEAHHYVGAGLVVSGMIVSSTHKPPADRTRGQLLAGMAIGALSVSLMAVGIVAVKGILERTDLVAAASLRLVGGTTVLALLMMFRRDRAALFSVFKPSPVWKVSVPASILGMYVAMLLWVAGFKYAPAANAAILNQTSTVIALILATLVLKEPFGMRKGSAAVLAILGVVVVTLGGSMG